MQSKYIRHSYLFTQRADTTADPNFAEFCDWLEHHKWRRSTVTGAVAGMAAGAGMVGAKVSSNIQFWKLNLKCKMMKRRLYFLFGNPYILVTQELQAYDFKSPKNVPKAAGFQPRKKDEIG